MINSSNNNILIYHPNQIVIPDSLKIELNNKNIKENDLFKLITKNDLDYSFHVNLSLAIISWIIKMARNLNKDDELERIINSLRPIIKIIERKRNSWNHPVPKSLKDNINDGNTLMDTLSNWFDYLNNSINFLISPIEESCH